MKNKFIITVLLLMISKYLVAQNTILDFQIGIGGVTKNKMLYRFDEQNLPSARFSKANFLSVGLSNQVYKFVYIRSEFGIVSAENYIDFSYSGDQSSTYGDIRWDGRFQTTRIYLGFIPEIRALKGLLYLNAGLMLCKDASNGFVIGSQSYNNSYTDLSGKNMSDANLSTGTTIGFGVNPTYKNVGFKLGFKFMNLSPIGVNDSNPNIGFSTAFVSVGISHTIK